MSLSLKGCDASAFMSYMRYWLWINQTMLFVNKSAKHLSSFIRCPLWTLTNEHILRQHSDTPPTKKKNTCVCQTNTHTHTHTHMSSPKQTLKHFTQPPHSDFLSLSHTHTHTHTHTHLSHLPLLLARHMPKQSGGVRHTAQTGVWHSD